MKICPVVSAGHVVVGERDNGMRKIHFSGIILLMLSMAVSFCGCKGNVNKAEGYNQFEVKQMLTVESTYGILGTCKEGILFNDYRIMGSIEHYESDNSFWIYEEENDVLQEVNFAGLEKANAYFLSCISPQGEVLIADEMHGVLALFHMNGTLILQKEMSAIGLTDLEENGIACIGCDEEYIYINTYHWGEGTGDFMVLNYSMELIYQQPLQEEMAELVFLPNLSGPCMFTPDNGETMYVYAEGSLLKVKNKSLPNSEDGMLLNGVFCGDDLGCLNPQSSTTRAEFATIMKAFTSVVA